MSNKKISAFSAATPQASDDFVIARGGDNYKVSFASVAASLSGAPGMETGVSKIFASGEEFRGDVTLEATDGIFLRTDTSTNTIIVSGCIPCDTICKVEWLIDSWTKWHNNLHPTSVIALGLSTYYDFVNAGSCSFSGPPNPVPSVSVSTSVTPTPTVTPSLTATPTVTPSITPVVTPSLTPQNTATPTPSVTPSLSVSNSVTPSLTPSITITPSITTSVSSTPSLTPSTTPDLSPSVTPTLSTTPWATVSTTPTTSLTPSITTSVTVSESQGAAASVTPSASPTVTPSITVSPSLTPSISVSVTPDPTPSITLTPTITPSVTPSLTPSLTSSPSLTPTPTVTPSLTTTPTETPSVTITPTVTPSPPTSDELFVTFNFNVGESTSETLSEVEGNSAWTPDWNNISFDSFSAVGGGIETPSQVDWAWVPDGALGDPSASFYSTENDYRDSYNLAVGAAGTTTITPWRLDGGGGGFRYFLPESDATTTSYGECTWNRMLNEQENWFYEGNVANFWNLVEQAEDIWTFWPDEGGVLAMELQIFTFIWDASSSQMRIKHIPQYIYFDSEDGFNGYMAPTNATRDLNSVGDITATIRFTR